MPVPLVPVLNQLSPPPVAPPNYGSGSVPLRPMGVGTDAHGTRPGFMGPSPHMAIQAGIDAYKNSAFNDWYSRQSAKDLDQFRPTTSALHATVDPGTVDTTRTNVSLTPKGALARGNMYRTPAEESAVIRQNAREHFHTNVLPGDEHYNSLMATYQQAKAGSVPLAPTKPVFPTGPGVKTTYNADGSIKNVVQNETAPKPERAPSQVAADEATAALRKQQADNLAAATQPAAPGSPKAVQLTQNQQKIDDTRAAKETAAKAKTDADAAHQQQHESDQAALNKRAYNNIRSRIGTAQISESEKAKLLADLDTEFSHVNTPTTTQPAPGGPGSGGKEMPPGTAGATLNAPTQVPPTTQPAQAAQPKPPQPGDLNEFGVSQSNRQPVTGTHSPNMGVMVQRGGKWLLQKPDGSLDTQFETEQPSPPPGATHQAYNAQYRSWEYMMQDGSIVDSKGQRINQRMAPS